MTLQNLRQGRTSVGFFLLSCSSIIAETCATLPADWLIVDMEASPASHQEVLHVFQALNGSGVTPMVRTCALDHYRIEQLLDLGAHAVLVPKVENATDARKAASACRYPPEGRRGINPVRASGYFSDVPAYLAGANAQIMCMVQIESGEAVERAPEIASTPGVDVTFIGCGDLASSLGQPGVVTGKRMDEARARVLSATQAAGKVPGIFAYSLELAVQYAREGFRFIALGNDLQALRDGIRGRLDGFSARGER